MLLKSSKSMLRCDNHNEQSLFQGSKGYNYAFALRRRNDSNFQQMKSSPYVGWFRHAPPFSKLSIRTESFSVDPHMKFLTSCMKPSREKSSPYVGWFRHSPPSTRPFSFVPSNSHDIQLCDQMESMVKNISFIGEQTFSKPNLLISGRLKGGNPLDGNDGYDDDCSKRTKENIDPSRNRNTYSKSSSTFAVLTKLANWIIYPLVPNKKPMDFLKNLGEDAAAKIIMPLLLNTLKKVLMLEDGNTKLDLHKEPACVSYADIGYNVQDDLSSCCSSESDTSKYSDYDNHHLSDDCHKSLDDNANRESDDPAKMSLSSLAEAYYAERECRNIIDQLTMPPTISNKGLFSSDIQEEHSSDCDLDYIITQMDIIQMARNASRHLDVESILSLPTITYYSDSLPSTIHFMRDSKNNPSQSKEESASSFGSDVENEASQDSHLGWSWVNVPNEEANFQKYLNSTEELKNHQEYKKDKNTQHHCVICLEEFKNGDRLRVLPCNHLFHMGCIDKWLSGSLSYQECFTSGCPTCKKTPTIIDAGSVSCDSKHSEGVQVHGRNEKSGSLPSWAFKKLGVSLASQR
mmetsp:Transcript_21322/g.29890  ORF Transcript_21322/g.29890 Transcript_21322/m.29890 type:complete len:574 (-) Transcript_21322:3803-5524(-)